MKEKESIYLIKERNNRTFGIKKEDFSKEKLDKLKEFGEYITNNNIKSKVEVTIVSIDKNKIINKINIYIKNDKYALTFKNVYCGGVYGTDRIFDVLYNFEYVLEDLLGVTFNHYGDYSLSKNYLLL